MPISPVSAVLRPQNFGAAVVRAVVALLLSRYRVALHRDLAIAVDPTGLDPTRLSAAQLAERTAEMTRLAVVTKLKVLKLLFSRRE